MLGAGLLVWTIGQLLLFWHQQFMANYLVHKVIGHTKQFTFVLDLRIITKHLDDRAVDDAIAVFYAHNIVIV